MGAWRRCHLLLLFLFISSHASAAAAASPVLLPCREPERKALLELKRQFRDPSNRLSSWVGEECCAWEGVGCSNTTRHVVKLDLRNIPKLALEGCSSDDLGSSGCKQALGGQISSSLLSLRHLTYLDLSGNNFGLPIPSFLGSLTRLTYLNLSGAGFIDSVPHQLGNLTDLHYLDLSQNIYFYGGDGLYNNLYLENLEWISRLSSLRLLNMSWVNLVGASDWLQALNALPLIREVELAYCELGVFPSLLPHTNIASLTTLSLRGNYINSVVPDWLFDITTLEFLDLGDNYMNFLSPASFAKLTSLKVLDLSGNVFSNGFLPGALSNLCKLQSLHLEEAVINDVLSDLGAVFSGCLAFRLEELDLRSAQLSGSFPHWLENMKNLKYLDLSQNLLNGSLPYWLGSIKGLQHLDLSANSLNGSLPVSFGNMPSLQYLDMSSNDLDGIIGPDWLGSMKNLEYLDLSYNSFSGSLPTSLGNLSFLQHLDLNSNDFEGMIGEYIAQMKGLAFLDVHSNSLTLSDAHLANLSSLAYLYISHNSLVLKESDDWTPPFRLERIHMSFCQILPRPRFPQWLQTQNSLVELYIDDAGIEGAFPNWLPSGLKDLVLSNNQIRCDIPQLFPQFPNMRFLLLSNNSFSGQIPTSIGEMMPHLEYLDISYNKLTGNVLSNFSNLRTLVLSNNMFSGFLPSRISQTMPKLKTLDLSVNKISGRIPFSFCQKIWYVLRLSNNSLTGEIPNCWKNYSEAMILDFSFNQLQGKIPGTVSNCSNLQSLHLSHNYLSGEIPHSLKNCENLVTLDLGYNKFTGNIPTWLEESFPYLKTLSLRSNAFSGSTPQLSNLQNLRILDLSNNNLSGSIPRSFSNFSALKTPSKSDTYLNNSARNDEMWLLIKGSEREYNKLLLFMTAIDLSNNKLSGNIPEELENLRGLQSLNLSGNCLTGEIPEYLSKIQQLESLDLSRNNLSGGIPSSLGALYFLSHLNLSYNNLSGRIPTGNQLQTLNDPSIYVGNPGLCGPPLNKSCTENAAKGKAGDEDDGESRIETIWLYASAALGFIVGFWTLFGTLLLKWRWRILYFQVVDRNYDRLYIMIMMVGNMTRIKQLFMRY